MSGTGMSGEPTPRRPAHRAVSGWSRPTNRSLDVGQVSRHHGPRPAGPPRSSRTSTPRLATGASVDCRRRPDRAVHAGGGIPIVGCTARPSGQRARRLSSLEQASWPRPPLPQQTARDPGHRAPARGSSAPSRSCPTGDGLRDLRSAQLRADPRGGLPPGLEDPRSTSSTSARAGSCIREGGPSGGIGDLPSYRRGGLQIFGLLQGLRPLDNRITRYRFDGTLSDPKPIVTGILKGGNHNGAAGLAFGPDGFPVRLHGRDRRPRPVPGPRLPWPGRSSA